MDLQGSPMMDDGEGDYNFAEILPGFQLNAKATSYSLGFHPMFSPKHGRRGHPLAASTLYRALANSGDQIHVFTAPSDRNQHETTRDGNLYVHFAANDHGSVNFSLAYEMFHHENEFRLLAYGECPLLYWLAKMLPNLAVTWHGIWYEIMHPKIFQELIADPKGQFPGPMTDLH
ncbi:hypothetical protein BUALT_Bualt03G0143600 [Buddleja alternifolia]|uniref:Glycosyltransferase n=1 Tax=Buddleja alternifolia TaxID=168488 RepID=A0AAV6Y248_9LAMI|nr:hypothetical protein BUALT_Bualt03G0143600 [Buddleja alternifolia]